MGMQGLFLCPPKLAERRGGAIKKEKDMKRDKKLFAILGGMGPDASARLVTRIIELSREIGGAINSDDYPNFVMQNIPVPDFFDNPELYVKGLKILKQSVKQLSKLDPEYLVIACNTVHSVIPELSKETKRPFMSLPQLIAREVSEMKYKKIGLLATPLTYTSKIYCDAFNNVNIDVIEPIEGDKVRLGNIVHLILRGEFELAREKLILISDKLVNKGVEAIILGCTELPLVFPSKYIVPTISSVESLARSIVIKYYQEESI